MTAHLLAEGAFWPTASLVIFLSLFVTIVVWVFIVPKARWQRDAEIPLERDAKAPRDTEGGRHG